MNVNVTIGRNIGAEPMRLGDWNWFKYDVIGLIPTDAVILNRGPLKGQWEGQSEECWTISFLVDSQETADVFCKGLVPIAAKFHQDAIAVLVCEVRLIGPES